MNELIEKALEIAMSWGTVEGDHHKMWVIDQMVRALTGCPMQEAVAKDCNGKEYTYQKAGSSVEYERWLVDHSTGDEGPNTYEWDEGITP